MPRASGSGASASASSSESVLREPRGSKCARTSRGAAVRTTAPLIFPLNRANSASDFASKYTTGATTLPSVPGDQALG